MNVRSHAIPWPSLEFHTSQRLVVKTTSESVHVRQQKKKGPHIEQTGFALSKFWALGAPWTLFQGIPKHVNIERPGLA